MLFFRLDLKPDLIKEPKSSLRYVKILNAVRNRGVMLMIQGDYSKAFDIVSY